MTEQKFDIILADPPWLYANRDFGLNSKSRFGGGAERHYTCMSLKDICNLKVKDIAADDCLLFIWVTGPYLERSFEVIHAWGFQYVTIAYNWVKLSSRNMKFILGTGYYQKANSELCLIGKRGKGLRPAVNDVNQIISTEFDDDVIGIDLFAFREGHSEKPIAARQGIERLYPTANKIELFCREEIKGWSRFGNQIESDIQLESGE